MSITRKKKQTDSSALPGYDYSTPEAREETAAALFTRARSARTAVESEWQRCNDYYNFIHDAPREALEHCREAELPWIPAGVPDPWIMVESQIDPTLPQPEFRGRDSDMDSVRARQREYAVRYIMDNNRLADMVTRNERRLLKYGDAFWKAYWDADMRCGTAQGDIRVADIPVDSIFPDPSIRDGTIQDGQFVDYVYRVHKVRFCQLFAAELKALGLSPEEICEGGYVDREGLFDMTTALDEGDDTVQVLEHWFRQPFELRDGRGGIIPAGAVACSIQAGGRELRYIPNYWERTCRENQLFPFVHYWRIQDENRFWNKSELFPILDLVDAADRKLAMGLLNDAFMANDILLVEDGAISDGCELTNEPGAVIRTKPNRIKGVARLGGMQSAAHIRQSMEWFKEEIARTNRIYESNLGRDTVRQTTASGLAMLRSDATEQQNIKKADRNAGFERLFELLDWLALEFYDDDRMLFLGADPQSERSAVAFRFNADALAEPIPALRDEDGAEVRGAFMSWPRVDVTVSAGDGQIKGRQALLQALQTLSATAVTPDNWRLLAAELEILDIPGKKQIIDDWERHFTQMQAQAQTPGTAPVLPAEGGAAV